MLHIDVGVHENAAVLELGVSMSSLFPVQDSVLREVQRGEVYQYLYPRVDS